MFGYTEVTVVVDGAHEVTEEFNNDAALDAFIAGVEKDAKQDGTLTQVYLLYHEHAQTDGECACAQYLTDHHPAYVFNAPLDG